MTDPVADLMKRAKSAARHYKALSRRHLALIDEAARATWGTIERNDLDRQKASVAAEMAALSGPI